MDIDKQHLPMAFSSEYPSFDPLVRCHLQNSCQILQSMSTFHISISLSCDHIYHQYCLQYLEYKYLYCLKYIKNEINNNVKSIISRITEKNFKIEIDQEDEIQLDNDEPEELSKQILFDSEIANQFEIVLENFMKN